jgi:hypothetical protein
MERHRQAVATKSEADGLVERYGPVLLAILKRGEEQGEHISEGEMGRETGLEPTQVASVLKRLERDAQVLRTSSGNWELTPSASMKVQPKPHPKEPK